MVALSSFFSWPFALPSLPSISLPANIQRRFLSYVLKRALGRFVKTGGLDVDRIQAQISDGWVEIGELEVNEAADHQAINELIAPSLPLRLLGGSLSHVTAKVPFPNLWSAPLSIILDDVTLDFDLVSPSSPSSASQATHERRQPFPSSPSVDLAESVTSAADDFLHDELDAYEGAELDRSIRQSVILSQNDPFSNNEVPGGFPFSAGTDSGGPTSPSAPTMESKTALAGLVERILARLQVKVRNVRLRIRLVDPAVGGTFELRINEIQYADESDTEESVVGRVVRVLKFSSVAVYMVPDRASANARPALSSTSRSSSTSSSSSTADGLADMTMSLAVADLRQSTMSSIASGASVYHSALDEGDMGNKQEGEHDRSPTPTGPEPGQTSDVLLLSFGNDDILIRISTSQPSTDPAQRPPAGSQSTGRPIVRRTSTTNVPSSLPLMELSVIIGTISAVLLPRQMATLLAASHLALSTSASPSTSDDPSGNQARIEAKMRIKGIYLAAVYDMTADDSEPFSSSVEQFWAKPASSYLPVGHLKLRMDSITATYISQGHLAPPAPPSRRPTNQNIHLNRRRSTALFGPRPPTIDLTVSEASIFEYLATDSAISTEDPQDAIPGGAYPVLIFDTNLLKQYDLQASGDTKLRPSALVPPPLFPEYDTTDWRNSGLQKRSGGGEKAWRVRPKIRGVLKGVSQSVATDEGPAISMQAHLGGVNPAEIKLQPIHLFLDLSLVERLLPVLRFIAPSARSAPAERDVFRDIALSRQSTATPIPRGPQYVIDDLDAQAASVSTLKGQQTPPTALDLTCPLFRIDIRCPAPPNRRGTWGDGAHLRSGIVTLDLHNLRARAGHAGEAGRSAVGQKANTGSEVNVEWNKMILFFCRAQEKKAQALLVVGPLASDTSDPREITPLLPSVSISKVNNTVKGTNTSLVTCRIPSVQAKIRQTAVEGLQFFADDMTHWLDGAFGDGSAPKPRDDLKMIGSRFFGSKGSSSASSSADEDQDDSNAAMVLRVLISEIDLSLHVPRKKRDDISTVDERILSLQASDADVKLESNTAGKQETTLNLAITDAEFSDRSLPSKPIRILGRTTPLSLTMHNSPLVAIRFSSLTDPASGTKETGIKVSLSALAVFITKDLAWTTELARFAKTPEGVFEDMTPAEVTRVSIQLFDCSAHVAAPSLPGAVVVVLGVLEVKTDLISDAEESVAELSLNSGQIMAIDDMAVAVPLQGGYASSTGAWKHAGYAPMIELDPLELQLLRGLAGSKEVLLDIVKGNVKVTACADSLVALASLVGDLPNLIPQKTIVSDVSIKSPAELDQSINVFGSVDEDTFRRLPDPISGMDLIEDDLPTNLDYLDSTVGQKKQIPRDDSIEGLRSWQTEHDTEHDTDHGSDHLTSEINGETIKILVQEAFEMQEDYWDDVLPIDGNMSESDLQVGPIKVRVKDATLSVLLHDGYDWIRTRKAIEEEIKAVRRRLEKIRQLLASGQKADDSVERATSVLFNSIYIGLDQSKENLDAAALLAAIDDELDEMGDDSASQSSWQTLPAAGIERPFAKKTRLRGKRLTRSKKAQIEFALTGLSADIDLFGPTSETAARIHLTAKSVEILDHIKTSTWKKFLSEMRADSRGNIRETGADMLRVELTSVRPSLPHPDEELRLKAKVLPLRLHIDQDALDFLKRFFSFQQTPVQVPTPAGASTSQPHSNHTTTKGKELFFQHVEIFPVEIKLDYKPKRVDFGALREGKTIELMNFFHFDGAEMTLRHITMSGVSGLSRLSTLLQDIWTPDVKANQLADVISGVSPIRSMVNVGSGVADLILLPIEQYRKDGRVARGVQRGTNSFVRSTAMEMMKLGAKLATGTQVILERAEGVLGGGSRFREDMVGEVDAGASSRPAESDDEGDLVEIVSRYANQPVDAREGVQAAYKSLSSNINSAAQTILAVPMEVYERSGENGPLKAVVRAVPIAVLRPMIGASEAVSKTLLGVRNSLDPKSREELGDKYK